MNKNEYYNARRCYDYYNKVRKLLHAWKFENNISETCVIHHRDDTEECVKYNNEHYELWGFNLDGTFEYGKYVIFMTNSEHSKYHNAGRHASDETKEKLRLANKGKKLSDETKAKMSSSHKGKKFSEESCMKIRTALKGREFSDEWRTKISIACKGKYISDETKAKMSSAAKVHLASIKFLYNVYKNNGGIKKWNDFQAALKSGDITFEMQPISVFTNGGK